MTPEEQAKKMDEILEISVKGQKAIQAVADNQSTQQSVMEKVQTDLEAVMGKQNAFEQSTNETLATIQKQNELETKTAFDVVLNDPGIRAMHGYNADPVTRALYKPHVEFDRRKGWTPDREGYEISKSIADLNDQVYLLGMFKALASVRNGEPQRYSDVVKGLDTYKLLMFELGRNPEYAKALNTETSGQGLEWVPTQMSNQITDDIRLELKIAGLFPFLTIPMGTGSFKLPKKGTRQTAYLVGEPTSDSPSKVLTATPPSGNTTFDPVTFALRMLWSDDITEDAAIAMFPLVREELLQAIVDAKENSIINGDISDSTHFDSDVTSAQDVRKAYDGLRYMSGNSAGEAAVDCSTYSLANLRAIRKKMGRFGVNPMDLNYAMGIKSYVSALSIDEVETLEKFGPAFTAKNGVLAVLDGCGISVSEFIRDDLNVLGVYDGVTMTKTEVLLINTKAHYAAEKAGGMKVESARDIETLQNVAVASVRSDFKRVNEPGSGEATVGVGYNIAS